MKPNPNAVKSKNSPAVPLSAGVAEDKNEGVPAETKKVILQPTISSPERPAPVSGNPPQGIRVALVEDDAGLRKSLELMLNLSPGISCTCSCGSGEEALKLIPRNSPDIVLMDIHLPNRSGIECTAILRQQSPTLQIIMLTVYNDADTLFKALRAGACGYLLKRARPEEIIEAINEARRGGAPMSSEIARQVVATFQEPLPSGTEEEALSRREKEILDYLLRGFVNKDIATELSISVFTVKNHLRHIYEKLHVRCRTDVFLKYRDSRKEREE